MSNIWTFHKIENKLSLYRGEDCMKKFCIYLRERGANVIDFKKSKILPLTQKELKPDQNLTVCYICRKKFIQNLAEDTN